MHELRGFFCAKMMRVDFILFLCTSLYVSTTIVIGLEPFSAPDVNKDKTAIMSSCYFSKTTQSTSGICGYRGEACSIAVYTNQTDPRLHKKVDCTCWDEVFSILDKTRQLIRGKYIL